MIKSEFQDFFLAEFFQRIPIKIALIDRNFKVLYANKAFTSSFGDWENKFCYEVYKSRKSRCENCNVLQVFEEGKPSISQEDMTDKEGNTVSYLVHKAPLPLDTGDIPYIVEMSTDITEFAQAQKSYEFLFDSVPCYITVLNKDLQILQANRKFLDTFGTVKEKYCYQCYKRQDIPCMECPVLDAFSDGEEHHATMIGEDKTGNEVHYVVHAKPLAGGNGKVERVMEIATDITRVESLKTKLERTLELQDLALGSAHDGVILTGKYGYVRIMNQAAKRILGYENEDIRSHRELINIFPEKFFETIWEKKDSCVIPETEVISKSGERIPVRLSGVALENEGVIFGSAIYIQDLREIKRLEREKLDAERLAAVGQTVAGLAHGIKNILTGLEGGLYVMNTGLRKSNVENIQKGLNMLEGNIDRITHFVKEFLNFARGRKPIVRWSEPNAIVKEVYELYHDRAAQNGIDIVLDIQEGINQAPLDPEAIHACLANLVSNAIDACQMSENKDKKVRMTSREEDETICFEVSDNGIGMDSEVKKKVFTRFFSTKGSHEGTGLGLLVTRKLILEHGGSISVKSKEGEGATFSIMLPRHRLPEPEGEKE